jgi:F-type H+-transporting ATPase subunit delta
MIQIDPVANTYARSLIELASESGTEVQIGQELAGIAEVLAGTPSFGVFLADPAISREERGRLVKAVFGGRISPLLLSTLGVMNAKDRLGYLAHLTHAYAVLLEIKLGKIDVDVTVATALDPAALEEVRRLVSAALNKDAVVHQKVDESILGGFVLKVGDKLIDGSAKGQLEQLKRKLLVAK